MVAGINRTLHERLLLGEVLPREMNPDMGHLQYLPDGEPLSRPVECIRSLGVLILLPSIPLNRNRGRVFAREELG